MALIRSTSCQTPREERPVLAASSPCAAGIPLLPALFQNGGEPRKGAGRRQFPLAHWCLSAILLCQIGTWLSGTLKEAVIFTDARVGCRLNMLTHLAETQGRRFRWLMVPSLFPSDTAMSLWLGKKLLPPKQEKEEIRKKAPRRAVCGNHAKECLSSPKWEGSRDYGVLSPHFCTEWCHAPSMLLFLHRITHADWLGLS